MENYGMRQIGKAVAVLVILDVIVVYVYCLRIRRVYPPSHPWSGFALILLSILVLRPSSFFSSDAGFTQGTVWFLATVTFSVLAAGLWTFAAMLMHS
jgi:hypothetical protein